MQILKQSSNSWKEHIMETNIDFELFMNNKQTSRGLLA